ncbi:hypothetical protein I79_015803 [Cricetulus griseus]|uniref:Uncharacterized protein n=1 Tax=Cricetulus griseus TaxID=10029 RepID=G3HXP1_CRIGR|nr:hypothetical protein I79_015803 [Cricetulus griseus]
MMYVNRPHQKHRISSGHKKQKLVSKIWLYMSSVSINSLFTLKSVSVAGVTTP